MTNRDVGARLNMDALSEVGMKVRVQFLPMAT